MFRRLSWFKDFSGGEATIREGALIRRNSVFMFGSYSKQPRALTTLKKRAFENIVGKGENNDNKVILHCIVEYVANLPKRNLMGLAQSIDPAQFDHSRNFLLLEDFLCILIILPY